MHAVKQLFVLFVRNRQFCVKVRDVDDQGTDCALKTYENKAENS